MKDLGWRGMRMMSSEYEYRRIIYQYGGAFAEFGDSVRLLQCLSKQ